MAITDIWIVFTQLSTHGFTLNGQRLLTIKRKDDTLPILEFTY